MARIRTIKPKFWDDSKIGKISRDSRLLYIGLWTFSDDVGVVIGDTIWLKSKIFPYDQIQVQQFEKWLSELATNGFICQFSYNNENFIYLPKFARHQVINRPNVDDLNIPKNKLDNILSKFTEQSLINHGTFTEQSVPIKEEEKEEENITEDSNESPVCATSQPHDGRIDYAELVKFSMKNARSVRKYTDASVRQAKRDDKRTYQDIRERNLREDDTNGFKQRFSQRSE